MSMTFQKNKHHAVLIRCDNLEQDWIRIPEAYDGLPVTEIGAEAFRGNPHLKCVVLPMGIHTIGQSAFENCESLQCVGVGDPSALGKIPSHSVFPPTLNFLGEQAFANTKLVDMTFTGAVTIGPSCFFNCQHLKTVLFHRCHGTIGTAAFSNSSIEVFYMPDCQSGISLPEKCFTNCKNLRLIKLHAPKSIGKAALEGCPHVNDRGLYHTIWDVLFAMGDDASTEVIAKLKAKYDDLGLGDVIILVHEINKLFDNLSKVLADNQDTILVSFVEPDCRNSINEKTGDYHFALCSKHKIADQLRCAAEWSNGQLDDLLQHDDIMLSFAQNLADNFFWDWNNKEAIFCSRTIGAPFEKKPREVAVDLLCNYLDSLFIENEDSTY